MRLERIGPNRWRLQGTKSGVAEAVVYLSPKLRQSLEEEEALQQLAHAATLPGVVSPVVGMPDLHTGFGLPIGGVMATRIEDGIISAGAVGMDINCGVRLVTTGLLAREVPRAILEQLLAAILKRVPTGIGKKSRHLDLRHGFLEEVALRGAAAMVAKGFGYQEDLNRIEEGGCLAGARLAAVSREAVARADQLATLGGGNHFIELSVVDEVYAPETARAWGIMPGELTVLIHTGSRGFGHQICTDYSKLMQQAAKRYGIHLPTAGLACAPIGSAEGQDYLAAMACACNFAFANRQLITADVREAFLEVLGPHRTLRDALGPRPLPLLYDVAHNIAKEEEHGGRCLLVHRKGATRALPPGHPANPQEYRQTGHPAIIPGSMGTASYVVVGTPATAETYHSVNHGAGRVLSRAAARKTISREEFEQSMGDVLVTCPDYRQLLDEAPSAYKDVEEVVETLAAIGLTRKVLRLRPLAVIKGEGGEG
ncbi:MAG: RtcB family protein [Clostridia bacterium]|nr:RtcB family protein [Clostridia bacterium]